jgi:hypothetical protein
MHVRGVGVRGRISGSRVYPGFTVRALPADAAAATVEAPALGLVGLCAEGCACGLRDVGSEGCTVSGTLLEGNCEQARGGLGVTGGMKRLGVRC